MKKLGIPAVVCALLLPLSAFSGEGEAQDLMDIIMAASPDGVCYQVVSYAVHRWSTGWYSRDRAPTAARSATGRTKRSGASAFYRVKVLPAKPVR